MKPSPGPWSWALDGGDGDVWSLDDGQGRKLIAPGGLNYIMVRSDDDKTLVALAPEMREMLLELEWEGNTEVTGQCPRCLGSPRTGHGSDCKFSILLEKLR